MLAFQYFDGWFMVLNATFNNISAISWRSVLFVEYPEKITDLSQVTDKLYLIIYHTSPRMGSNSQLYKYFENIRNFNKRIYVIIF